MEIRVMEVVEMVGGRLAAGSPDRVLSGFGALDQSGEGDLSFYGNPKYQEAFQASRAGAVIVKTGTTNGPEGAALIEVENPALAFDVVVRRFGAPEVPFVPGVHATACVAPDAEFDPARVSIGAYVVVESGCKIGNGTRLCPQVVVSQGASLGEDCLIYPHVAIREGSKIGNRVIIHAGTVVGADGYGYEFSGGRHVKIRQAGIVEIHDDVEIGANCSIDRARFGSTVIGEGTKVDNLVQIAHNAKIGKHCLIVAQCGISGSATLGNYVTLAAQSGVAGHITIGDGAIMGGRSGVIASLEGKQQYFGYPAKPMKEWARGEMYQKKIPSLLKRIAELEKRLAELEKRGDGE